MNQADAISDFPPIAPVSERQAANDPAFANECLSLVRMLNHGGHLQTGRTMLTNSKSWGLVFRVDFTIDGDTGGGLINRAICWKPAGRPMAVMYAIGQKAAPLPGR
jgi:hypothetical protein